MRPFAALVTRSEPHHFLESEVGPLPELDDRLVDLEPSNKTTSEDEEESMNLHTFFRLRQNQC